ncbi:MAG: NUDIX domain-containing protein [Candidatus Staskawiczbacteria bacterium]
MEEKQRPKVGVGVMIFKDGKVLMGKRKNVNGAGEYAWPGGHLEIGESFESCAKRETMEEAGIEIDNVRFLRLMNFFKSPDRHYADIGLMADWKSGEPKAMEPEKCEGWGWYDIDNLPQPLFSTIPSYLEALKTGKNYFDIIKK